MTEVLAAPKIEDIQDKEHPRKWMLLVVALCAIAGGALTKLAWAAHDRFATFGFDTGIFAQGTWLLSRGEWPFVTIRGLNLFGDHASYILAVVSPLYALFPSPKLLLLVQVVGLVAPALVLFRIGRDTVGTVGAIAVSVAYLVYPAMNHAALWQFHPETLAATFLALAALFVHLQKFRWMAVALLVAMLCKEDVALVVAGFGAYLFFSQQRRIGAMVSAAGVVYFSLTTFVFIRLVNGGEGTIYTARLYGIEGDGIGAALSAIPTLVMNAAENAMSADGREYLAMVFVPLLMLPVLSPKWLLPICGPMLLNLASTTDYQRSIEYQYLATSGPFIALAALEGMHRIRSVHWRIPVSAALVLVALGCALKFGPVLDSWEAAAQPLPATDRERNLALKLVPSNAAVSAQANTVSHLVNRREVYEFPNPFRPANWGRSDDPVEPRTRDRVEYILVDPSTFGEADRRTWEALVKDPAWETLYSGRVTLLHKR